MGVLLALGVAVGIAARLVRPPENLVVEKVRSLWVLVLAALLMLAARALTGAWPSRTSTVFWYLATNGMLAFWCALNRRIPGVTLLLVGLTLNLVIVAVNVGMPVTAPLSAGSSPLYIPMEAARLGWLGDWISLGAGGHMLGLASPGDLVMAVAAAFVAWALPLDSRDRQSVA